MTLRRQHLLLFPALACLAATAPSAPEGEPVHRLYDGLLTAMKGGPALGFAGRLKALDPEVRRDYDLPLMTRLIVGPGWRALKPAEQGDLLKAFGDYSAAQYASQFDDYSGERFVVDPAPARLAGGDAVVRTRLIPKGGDPVELDYRVRKDAAGSWRIIDVYLNGTISELAARRSEYSAVLRTEGAEALARLLRKKAAQLGS